LLRPLEIRLSTAQLAAHILVAIYLFMLVGRIPELIGVIAGSGFSIFPATWASALLLTLLSGSVLSAMMSRPGTYLAGLTGWMILILPLSTWRTGSVKFLTDMWLKSFLAFTLVASAAYTLKHCRRFMLVLALATVSTALQVAITSVENQARLQLSYGSLAQANALSYHLLYGIPFVYLFAVQKSRIVKTVGILTMLWTTSTVLRTGSRAGLLELGILAVLIFLRLDGFNKIKFLGLFCAAILAALPFVTADAAKRWATLLGSPSSLLESKIESSENIDAAYLSAIESSESRIRALKDSVRLTLERPITGVGPGNFAAASSDPSQLKGRKAVWAETHNAYTKVSSECGIPGLALFVGCLVYCWRTAWKLYQRARRAPAGAQMGEIANQAYCLIMALSLFAFNGMFDGNSFMFYFPVLVGLTSAFRFSAERALAAHRPAPGPAAQAPPPAALSNTPPPRAPAEPPPIASAAPWMQPGPRTRTHPKFCR